MSDIEDGVLRGEGFSFSMLNEGYIIVSKQFNFVSSEHKTHKNRILLLCSDEHLQRPSRLLCALEKWPSSVQYPLDCLP